MSKQVVSAFITDVNMNPVTGLHVMTHQYLNLSGGGWDGAEQLIEGILLFPNKTARTNVALKGADGKFISFRDVNDHDIKAAVEMLKPFPTGA